MDFLKQFHLINKYNKGNTNKLEDMISIPPTTKVTTLGILMHTYYFTHDTSKEEYIKDEEFNEAFHQLQDQVCVDKGGRKVEYHLQDGFLYKQVDPFASTRDQVRVEECDSKVEYHLQDGFLYKKVDTFTSTRDGLWKDRVDLFSSIEYIK
jgi:hypothetical protein